SGRQIVCLLSDGELNEGSTWEAAAFAAHHRLTNLQVVVDKNGLQGFGETRAVLNMEPLADKWRAFGFDVSEVDGHDFRDLHQALSKAPMDRPKCTIALTHKGMGVRAMQDRMEWHYLGMSEADYQAAVSDLELARKKIEDEA